MIVRVGNAAGFSGDRVDAAGPVVATLVAAGGPAALFFEVLGERTVALAQLERRRDPARGYEPMLEALLSPVLRPCAEAGIPILGNFGAANPPAAAAAIAGMAVAQGMPGLRIAVVGGDDVRGSLDLDALQPHEADGALDGVGRDRLVSANAYMGAAPMVQALADGAQVVVAGRVSDPALALAPLIHFHGWDPADWDRMAAGAMAGHLLECGSQVTGGVFYDPGFKDVPEPWNLGFPIAEVAADGTMVITKAAGTGGCVTLQTVREQLLYELHDPAEYITPDVLLDITGVEIGQEGADRVWLRGARGRPAPERLKVTACYEGGYLGEGEVTVAGPNCLARARMAQEVLRRRMGMRGLDVRLRVDLVGVASVLDDDAGSLGRAYAGPEPAEVRVRLAAEARTRHDAEAAAREVLALLCCGPAGTGGARWSVVPRIATRSFLVPRTAVVPTVQVFTARQLSQGGAA